MTLFNPEKEIISINTLLHNEDRGELAKIANFYNGSNQLINEFKTYANQKVGNVALGRTFTYNANGDVSGVRVFKTDWTQSMDDESDVPITDITLSNNIISPGEPADTLVGSLTATGGVSPITFSIVNVQTEFKIANDNELQTAVASVSGTYPLTIRATDATGQTFDKLFSVEVAAFVNDYSVQFDGISEYLNLATTADIQFERTDSFSFSFWFKRDTGTGTDYVYSTNAGATTQGFGIYTDGSERINLRFIGTSGANRIEVRDTAASYTVGVWAHCVITYDGSSTAAGFTIYIDGSAVTPNVIQDALSTSTAVVIDSYIGARQGNANEFDGNIDELAIFDKELSSGEVTAIYNSGSPTDLTGHDGLIHWYRMGDSAGDVYPTITDAAGSLNAFMTNMSAANIVLDTP